MKKINLLDCTLRDGGYVNDWNFGHSVITGTYKRLDAAGVEYIEVGFLDDRRPFDINRSIVPNTQGYNKIFEYVEKKHAIPVAMIDFGTCSIENIEDCENSFIDGIRVIFKKEKMEQALPFCKKIKEKGYRLFIQAISITAYSDMELLEYVQKINEIKPYAFSIVDTYGLLDKRKLTNYFNLIDNNLDPEIKIGYHAHNNFQLAFSNSMKFLALETKRELIVDSTVYGMGKSAGNCASELIAMHMNQYYGTKYDISQFLEILDTDLMLIYQKKYWGYSYNFYISAMQNCHPDYVKYLIDKKTLTVSSINEILEKIPIDKKLLYDEKYIEKLYYNYQNNNIDDSETICALTESFKGKKVVLLGPGSSILTHKDSINGMIQQEDRIVISVNFVPELFECDYIFISNSKRYSKFANSIYSKKNTSKLIITSNITAFDKTADYIFNYQGLLESVGINFDNALLLCLSLLIKLGVQEVALAGFDGFTKNEDDYYDVSYAFATNKTYKVATNEFTMKELKKLESKIQMEFITESLYQKNR